MGENIDRVRELVREAEQKAAIQLRDQGARVYSSLAPPGYPRQPERQPGSPRRIGVLLGDAPPPFTETEQWEPIMMDLTTTGVPDEPFEPGPIPLMGIQVGEPPEEQPDTYALMLVGVTDRIAFVREFRRIRPDVGLNAAVNIVRNMPSELILTRQQAHRLANVGASFINSSEFVEGSDY